MLGRLAFGLVLVLTLALLPRAENTATAQAAGGGERVQFDSYDSVGLKGTFYPGLKGNKSPCAILLHAIGENRQKDGWEELAKALNGPKYGMAVLMFDFRGHGESVDVGPSFWTERVNLTLKNAKATKNRDKLSYKDFSLLDHYLMLVNDIAAAKHYLDTRNDSSECNSANTIIIGAEQGATLGSLWIDYAWHSPRTIPGILGVQVPVRQLEGEDVAAAIWLSISQSVGPNQNNTRVPVSKWIGTPPHDKLNMLFLYGDKDTKSAQLSKQLCETVLGVKPGKTIKLTLHKGLETKLAGRELLGKPLMTQDYILEYVQKVLNDRGTKPWVKREVSRTPLQRVNFERFR
jgi:hypothetical protein